MILKKVCIILYIAGMQKYRRQNITYLKGLKIWVFTKIRMQTLQTAVLWILIAEILDCDVQKSEEKKPLPLDLSAYINIGGVAGAVLNNPGVAGTVFIIAGISEVQKTAPIFGKFG